MKWAQNIINAFRTSVSGRPRFGQIIVPRKEDSIRDYPSSGLTPSRLAALLRELDDGSLSGPMQLFEEMEEKDAHLYSVANTRRLALTGLEWEIVSAANLRPGLDTRGSTEAAAYCREALAEIHGFDEALQHLSLAVGRNIAIAEIVWDSMRGKFRPIELVPVDFGRLVFDEFDRPRILTEEEPRQGMELLPAKFMVHTPQNVSGHPSRGGLLRVTAMIYLAKNLAIKDWMIFSEVFGMPVRVARYEPGASAEEKKELLKMLETLGNSAVGIFSRAVELQIIESKAGSPGAPYQHLVDFLNREMSKAWLGQTLTTDISGQSGSIAAARVHETVRQDILMDDIRKEANTVRRDLLTPMTRFRFGLDAPVPHFRRKMRQTLTPSELVEMLDGAVNRLGVRVPLGWAHQSLNIPQPADGDMQVLSSRS